MIGDKRNFSLSIWDHKDNFLCLLKSANEEINGQSYDEQLVENIYGEKTLSFNIPAYIFDVKIEEKESNFNEIEDSYKKEKLDFIKNDKWDYIFNEQKIRYIEYDNITNRPIKIEEFVLKSYTESRNGYDKVIQCQCESLAVYELAKIGWNINFDTDYITSYESQQNNPDLLTLDYWMQKIFYKETHLGRVSTTTECTYLLQGIQLRDEDGEPISTDYTVDSEGNYKYLHIEEPICTSTEQIQQYYNPTGWTWEVQSVYKNDPSIQSVTTLLYEEPTISVYNEVYPNQYKAFSYQKKIKDDNNNIINNPIIELLPHPIEEKNYGKRIYATDIKKRLIKAERSNVFSIIQTLCESFEVWAHFIYEYDDSGKIFKRKILFKTEAINEDIKFDFSYGKNLINCSRNINSNELITKLSIPDTNSNLDSDKILSIKQATANPTGEGYLYNFEYFYNLGILTKGEDDEDSDEYQINLHNATLKSCNNAITRLQKSLVPLYDRQNTLQSDLEIQQANYTATIENIQSIQTKINAIEPEEREIQSWSDDLTQSNYVGELKAISTTTVNGASRLYLDFGREDVLYDKNIIVKSCYFDNNNNFIEGTEISVTTYIPNYYSKDSFIPGTEPSPSFFIQLSNNIGNPIYSDEEHNYIKGFIFNTEINSYVRIRYKYAPLAYYYMLMRKYYNKLISIQEDIDNIEKDLQYIKNKIFVNELSLSNTLSYKNNLILQFEKKYKNFIREGYWEANDYQSQINPKVLDTNNTSSFYEGLITVNTKLSDLNLNDSLNNYSYYINLQVNADEIDFDSISMTTANPANTANTELPRYRGNDYEVFITNNNKVIIGISPVLIDSYKAHNYDSKYYKSTIIYNGENSQEYNWIQFNSNDSPYVQDRYIYLTNDNILTDSIVVYGESDTEDNLLTWGDDYTYLFDYAAYDNQGHRVSIDEQTSYSENIHYDYIIKIILKNTNKVNKFNSFIVKYNEENTLQFLYNDAVKTSHKYAVPQITYSISVLDISSLDEYKEYKPILGQKVPIYDVEMGLIGYQGIITSISKVLEKPEETNIEIATYQSRFEDIFQKLTSTMTEVKYNEEGLFNAADAITEYGTVKEEVFQKSLDDNNYKIQLGTNNDITIDKKTGITLVDNDDQSAVKIIGNGIFLTDNYVGNTSQWKTGITGNGINANVLTAGNIDTKNINIWNASEGQIRFIWNEQGLFAYAPQGINGTSASTVQDFVDYTKYVKFNYDGLKFKDGDRSALSLSWDGLKMDTLSGALKLDADQGLVLRQNNLEDSVTRLKLGKISDNSEEYGLKLYDSSGSTSFQSDSDGNLWLSRYINIGGEFSEIKEVPENVTAGIMGENEVPYKYQMGLMRDGNGDVYWNITPIRFWAGPQSYIQYIENTQIEDNEVNSSTTSISTILKSLTTNDPTFARFKVGADGNIIASGIDVGGWIGAGKLLKSKQNEAILRSDGYTTDINNPYPVIAVGKTSNSVDGRDYNFRVYQNGDVKINNGEIHIGGLDIDENNISLSTNTFKTDDNGTILYANGFSTTPQGTSISTSGFQTNSQGTSISTNGLQTNNQGTSISTSGFQTNSQGTSISTNGFQTNNQGTSLSTSTFNTSSAGTSLSTNTFKTDNKSSNFLFGTMAGWNATSTGLSIITGDKQYGTFVNATTKQDGITFQSGKQGEPSFYVQNDGYVYAKNLHIEGGSINISGSGLISNSTGTSLSGNKSSVNIGGLTASSTQTSLSTPSFKTDTSNSTYLITGEVAGWTATSTGLEIITNSNNVTYKTAMYSKKGVSDTTFQSGPSAAPTFIVKNDGSVKADNIQITGNSLKNETDKIINTSNFSVTKNGKVTATAGNIAGWEISTTTLSTTVKVGNKTYYEGIQKPESATSIVFYAGENKSEPRFKVLADGTLFAEDAVISGTVEAKLGGSIAGFTIGQKALWNGKDSFTSTTGGIYLGTDGISLGGNNKEPAFKVTKDGYVEATNIKITGAQVPTYDTKVLEFTDSTSTVIFSVTKEGKLSAKSGDLAGWTFTSTSINKENNFNNKNYKTGLEIPSSSTSKVFYAGAKNNPEFYIQADGTVVASKLVVTSGTLGNAFNNVNNNITSLSTNINDNIQSLSTDINNNITSLSTDINNNINILTNNIVQQITGLSTDLNQQITNLSDGQIEVWYYAADPTNSNSPAKDWNNNDKKEAHLGDLYYNTSTGEAFRYTKENNSYKWKAIPEYSVIAQQLAEQAKEIADGKRTVFSNTTEPHPYDIGDLWIKKGSNDEQQVWYATVASNTYISSHWKLTATDDTIANNNIKSRKQVWFASSDITPPKKPTSITTDSDVKGMWTYYNIPSYSTNFPYYYYTWETINGAGVTTYDNVIYDSYIYGIKDGLSEYIESVSSEVNIIKNQIDNQIEVWYYSGIPNNNNDPARNWDTDSKKKNHIGDLYYDTVGKKGYRYEYNKDEQVYSWKEYNEIGNNLKYIADSRAIADSKRVVFTELPKVPYDIGDIWMQDNSFGRLRGYFKGAQLTSSSGLMVYHKVIPNKTYTFKKKYLGLYIEEKENPYFDRLQIGFCENEPTIGTIITSITTRNYNVEEITFTPTTNENYFVAYILRNDGIENINEIINNYYDYSLTGDFDDLGVEYLTKYCKQAKTENESYNYSDWELDYTARNNIKNQIQLWYTTSSTTFNSKPNPDNKSVIINSNTTEAWTRMVPSYNPNYPNYYYCWEYTKGDDSVYHSEVVYDKALTESLDVGYFAKNGLASLSTNEVITKLKTQIDNKLVTHYITGINTLPNSLMNDQWINSEHIGDLCYNETSEKGWEFTEVNGQYEWKEVTDTIVIQALKKSINAQITADKKIQTFYPIPKIPYDVGDIWIQDNSFGRFRGWFSKDTNTDNTLVRKYSVSGLIIYHKVIPGKTYTFKRKKLNLIVNNLQYEYMWYGFTENEPEDRDVLKYIGGGSNNNSESATFTVEEGCNYFVAYLIRCENNNTIDSINNYYEYGLTGDFNNLGVEYLTKYCINSKTTENSTFNYSDWILVATDNTIANMAFESASTAITNAQTAQETANSNIKYENQLWWATDSAIIPDKPTTKITQNGNVYKQWTLAIPVSNVGYPYYYYCFQRELADGSITTSNVSYDSHSVGGFLASTTGLQLQKVNNYYIGMQPPANKAVDDVVIYAGTKGVAFTTNEFVVKANGNLKATNAEIIGNISASTGYIGGNQGFTILNKKLYNGKSTLDGTSNGVYIGTDGISVGSNNKYFKAKNDGTITANGLIIQNGSISIGGFTANSTSTIIDGTNKDIRLNIPNFISNSNPGSGFTGQIAGWYAKEDRLQITKTDNNKTYGTLLIATTSSTGIAIQAGDINSPAFTVKNDGSIISTSGTIGGWSITDSYLHKINTNANNKFYVGLHAPSNSTDVVFYAGTKGESTLTNNEFYVRANGQIKATGLTLTADNISDFQSKVEQYAPDADVSSIGGFTNNNTGDSKGLVQSIKPAESTTTYYVGIKPPTSNNNVILYAGTVGEGSTSNTFYVRSDGYLKASSGNIGGWDINGSYLYTGSDINNNKFYVGMHRPTASTNIVFYAGTTNHANASDEFYVTANGYLKASSGNIGGWDINRSNLQKKNGNALTGLYPNSNNSNAVIFVGSDSNPNTLSSNTKFKVTGQGDVYFNNNIYGWSNSQNTFKPGLNSGQITLPDSNGNQISVEINKGLIIDIR